MRCLYITSKPIYPVVDGGCFAMDSFLKTLQHTGFEVEHLAIATQKHPFDTEAYPKELKTHSVEIDTSIKPLQALKFIIKKGAYNVERFHSDKVLAKIDELIKNNQFDFIILDSLYSTTYLPSLRKIFEGKIYLRSHNCEAQIWFDLAQNEKNLPKSAYYKKLAKDLDKYEKEVIRAIDGVLAISHEDLDLFLANYKEINACVIPVHLKASENVNFNVAENQIFHIGNMDWIPNREAVDRLLNLFQSCKKVSKNLKLALAGKNSNQYYKHTDGVNIIGFVTDLKSFAQTNGILVSPISSSSGVRIKILEMMSYGVPVITTPAGARGILPEGKKIIEINNTDKELVDTIVNLSSDKNKLEQMKHSAIEYIRVHHNIDLIASDLKTFILGR